MKYVVVGFLSLHPWYREDLEDADIAPATEVSHHCPGETGKKPEAIE